MVGSGKTRVEQTTMPTGLVQAARDFLLEALQRHMVAARTAENHAARFYQRRAQAGHLAVAFGGLGLVLP